MTESGALFKVIIIGNSSVGKTSFVQKYVNNTFNPNCKPTMGVDFALKVINWSNDCQIKVQLWDIAGQERFTSITRPYYRNTKACIVMFDITNKYTFENTIRWKEVLDEKCRLHDGSQVPCLLVANKCDMTDSREVSQEDIGDLCKDHGFMGWSETSVKEGLMVEESMEFLIQEMMTKHTEPRDFTDSYHLTTINSSEVVDLNNARSLNSDKKCPC